MEKIDRVALLFEALGNDARLRILSLLEDSRRPLHIKALARELKLDYAAVYRHVKMLHSAGLIEVYEVGRSRVLALAKGDLLRDLLEKADRLVSS